MRTLLAWCAGIALLLSATVAAAGQLSLTIHDGRVTLVADQVPLRQILQEWARVGQTKMINAERVAGAPVTLRMTDVPEAQALQTLLRTVSGYVAAPRAAYVASASMYDRILIMPTSSAAPAANVMARPGSPGPAMSGAAPPPVQPTPGTEATEVAEQVNDEPQPAPAGPVMNPYVNRPPETNFDYANPQQLMQRRLEQQQNGPQQPPALFPGSVLPGQQPPAPTSPPAYPGAPATTMPGTTARPGEIVQPQTPPNTIVNPYGLQMPTQPPAQQPDRAKYQNPYQPQPQAPPPQE